MPCNQKIMDQEKSLVVHHVSLAKDHNLERASDLITQLHLTDCLPEGQMANEEILKKLDLQHADSTLHQEDTTIKQFVFQGQCLILGDSGVGKTSLVKSLTGNAFDPGQPKTKGIEQSLVDKKWKNVSMRDLILGNLFSFYRTISIQLNLYGHAETSYVLRRDLVYNNWRNTYYGDIVNIFLLFFTCVAALHEMIFSNPDNSTLTLYIIVFFLFCFRNVFIFFFNCNHHFRLIVAIFYFIARPRGLLIGAFHVFMLVVNRCGTFSVNDDGMFSMIIIAAFLSVSIIFVCLGIRWQCSYKRQLKFTYKRSIKDLCFMPLPISVLVSYITCFFVKLQVIHCFRVNDVSVEKLDKLVKAIMFVFVLYFTGEIGKSTTRYTDAIKKWPCRETLKEIFIRIIKIFSVYCLARFWFMFIYMRFDSTIICVFLSDTIFREWQDIQKLEIEGNRLTLVVIEKQDLEKTRLKTALYMKFSRLKLKILDFAGDKEYYTYHHMFLRKQAIYIIVFNIADFVVNNFREIGKKVKGLQFWFDSVCSHVPSSTPVFLVGTHRGNMDENCMKILDKHLRTYLWDCYCDVVVVNDTQDLIFFPVENSDGKNDIGVQCLQNQIVSFAEQCKDSKETIGCDIPLSWIRIQDAIISLREKKVAKFCVTLNEFPKVFDTPDNFICKNWSEETLKYFHENGLVIYLDGKQETKTSNWVLLKPEILVDIIIQLVTPSPENTQERGLRRHWKLLQKKGLLTKSLLRSIISKQKENEEAMTAFLEECDLICSLEYKTMKTCSEHDEKPTHFVPSLLTMSAETDTPMWHDNDTDKKCYVFFDRFLPEPLFHCLLSRAHKNSKSEFPNGQTVLFRDAGKFWMNARENYYLKLMNKEKMIEVTFSRRKNHRMRPSDVLCQVFSMVDGICRRDFPFVKFHCGPACPSHKCPGHQHDYLSFLGEEEQGPRCHVYNVMPARQEGKTAFLYCEGYSFEEELDEWVP